MNEREPILLAKKLRLNELEICQIPQAKDLAAVSVCSLVPNSFAKLSVQKSRHHPAIK